MNKKIYITGPVGSGKTTLAVKLANITGIESHSLDIVMYQKDDSKWGNVPRDEKVRTEVFNSIMVKDRWIIEDAGRERFNRGFDEADTIILVYPHICIRYLRIITRYVRQKLRIEKCNYNPSFKMLKLMFGWTMNFEKGTDTLENRLSPYKEKLIILKDNKDVRKLSKSINSINN